MTWHELTSKIDFIFYSNIVTVSAVIVLYLIELVKAKRP